MGTRKTGVWDQGKQTGRTFDIATSPTCNNPCLSIWLSHPCEAQENRSWTPRRTLDKSVNVSTLAIWGRTGNTQNTKTNIVVSIRCVVPVAGGGTQPRRFVVPRTAAKHTTHICLLPLWEITSVSRHRIYGSTCLIPMLLRGNAYRVFYKVQISMLNL